jgi:hypothetical protein
MLRIEDWTFSMLTGKILLLLAFIISLVGTISRLYPLYYSISTDKLSESIGIGSPTFRIEMRPYYSKIF